MFTSPLAAWLLLHHLPGLGPLRLQRLYQEFGSAQAILAAPSAALKAIGVPTDTLQQLTECLDGQPSQLRDRVELDLEWADQPGQSLLCFEDERYPGMLRWIPDPPAVLYVRGRFNLLREPQIAMVGTRNPTAGGRENARSFAVCFGQDGLTVTSGMALGIDAAAHEAVLSTGAGTVAVLGTGVDIPYPASHARLAEAIAEQGALVSEFPLGTVPKAHNFPRRNRIISGLSMGTLVVEASVRSGSLITARLALEQGREVYAIPGSIHNPQARGCHYLIKQGAKLVETVEDVMEELPALLARYQAMPPQGLRARADTGICQSDLPGLSEQTAGPIPTTPQYEQLALLSPVATVILEALGYDPVSADVIVARTGLSAQQVLAELMSLELSGQVTRTTGGYQRS